MRKTRGAPKYNWCCVPNCPTKAAKIGDFNVPYQFYRFPKNNFKLKRKWLLNLKFKKVLNETICGRHFRASDFLKTTDEGENLLKPNAVPSLFLSTKEKTKSFRSTTRIGKKILIRKDRDRNINKNENQVVFIDVQKDNLTNNKYDKGENENNEYSCCFKGCSTTVTSQINDNSIKFYRLPSVNQYMTDSYQHVQKKRRQAWLESIKCTNISPNEIQICSKHFHSGSPANVLNYCHVDWVPTFSPGNNHDEDDDDDDDDDDMKMYKPYSENMGLWIFADFTESDSSETMEYNLDEPFYEKVNESLEIKDSDRLGKTKIELTHFSDYDDSEISSDEDYFPNDDGKKMDAVKLESQKLPSQISCLSCNEEFDHNTAFFEHKLANVECMLMQIDCNVCGETMNGDRNDIKMHVANHLLPRTYYCKYCDRDENASVIQQYEHLLEFLGEHFYICAMCGDAFEENDELWKHINTIHPNAEGIAKQNFIDIKPLREIKEPKKVNHDRTMCEQCGTFVTNIAIHMDSHQKELIFPCSICGNSFRSKRYLVKHQQSHKLAEGFDCEYCGKKFLWMKSFILHMKKFHPSNSDEVFPCKYCRMKYSHEQVRDFHEKIHRTFECNLCDKEFKVYKQLHFHIKNEHPETVIKSSHSNLSVTHQCNICDITFISKDDIDLHMKTHYSADANEEDKSTTTKIINFTIAAESESKNIPSTSSVKHLILKPVKFLCKQCNASFKNESTFVQHKVDVHNKKFRCVTCGLLTDNILVHMRQHRFCYFCQIDFGSIAGLKEHQIAKHGG